MIAIRLQGGLGNQMFQYAYGRELASRGYEVVYEDASFEADPLREYELDKWRTEVARMGAADRTQLPRRFGGKGFANWFHGRHPLKKVGERPLGFHPRFLAPPRHAYLTGYWQGERFFPGVRDELLEAFQPARPLGRESQAVSKRIETTDAVAIHVRRTDYLRIAFAQVCGLDYYERCIAELLSRHEGLELFVFSDDLAWCAENLRFGCPMHFVGHNRDATAYEDLWLMSRCRRHVIPNSSFSWWAAWLKPDQQGEVYVPTPWSLDPKWDSTGVACPRWLATPGTLTAKRRAG